MRYLNFVLFTCLFASVAYAGGAAALVGKNSTSKGYSYDVLTELKFVNDCKEDANENVCRCVLEKIKGQYSEKEYNQIDYDLGKNIPHSDFVKFVTKASHECDAENTSTRVDSKIEDVPENDIGFNAETATNGGSEGLSEEAAREYVDNVIKNIPKKTFVSECIDEPKKLLGEKNAKNVCGCAYDHMVNDKPRFIAYVMENGIPEDDSWGAEYMIECLPEKFTPEIKKNLINTLNTEGIPKSVAQCIVSTIEKEYSLKNFVAASLAKKESTMALFGLMATKCMVEQTN